MKKIQDGHLPRLPDLVWNDPAGKLGSISAPENCVTLEVEPGLMHS